ncbi:MAG: lanthionine synthetase LanC family protein [Flavobacterium sp.]
MELKETVLLIEKHIWDTFNNENSSGLYLGISGIILFYDSLYQAYPSEEFEDKLLSVIEKADELIQQNDNLLSICSGIAGYGITLLRLKNATIEISEDYYETIDSFLIEEFELLCQSNNFDFMHGAMGIAMYFIERYKANKNPVVTKILSDFAENLICKINKDFKNVLIESDESRGDYYSFGLAHGVAGYLNFILYLQKHFTEMKKDITKALRICVDFLVSYKKYDPYTKQYYANVVSLETNKFIPSRLSWCQGDLGVSNALYNTGVFLDDKPLIEEAVKLMNQSAIISFEDSAVDDFGICHGSSGILLQIYFASKKYNLDYTKEINRWFESLKNQTTNFQQYLWYENSSCTYIAQNNLLIGSAGLAMTLLTLDNKINANWLELLNLH